MYVNDPQQFSVEIIHLSRASDKHWGFAPSAITRRPQPDTHAIERTVHIAAPPDVTWQVISDHEAMSQWAGIGPVRRILDGDTGPNGRGALRVLNIGGRIVEQVTADNPPDSYRYRIIKGSPFVCHQGELLLRPHGDGTALTWKIRFRPRIPGTGRLIAAGFSRALNRMMTTRLRRHVERLARQEDAIA